MKTPFTTDQFLEVFRDYNETVYPVQIVFYLLAIIAAYLAIESKPKSEIISVILAFFWLWMGVVYHILFFSDINKLAYGFGALFIFQGILFFLFGVHKGKITFRYKHDIFGITGLFFIVFALFMYPLLGSLGSHAYPYSPTFGLPCPTAIFTFGLILLSDKKFPFVLLIIPFLWSVLGMSAALNFGIQEDWFLIIAGVTTFLLTLIRNRKFKQHSKLVSIEF